MLQLVLAVCRHLPTRYREHTAPDFVRQRHRIVLALDPEKSVLEHSLVAAGIAQHVWDLTITPEDARVQRMQQTHRDTIAQMVAPTYIACLSSTWIRASNTAGLSHQALARHYPISSIVPCRLLDSSQFSDLTTNELYRRLYTAYVQEHGTPPEDPAFLKGAIVLGSSFYQTWMNGRRFLAQLFDDPVAALHNWGHRIPIRQGTLLVIVYSHKEVWEQIVTDAYPGRDHSFDGSLSPGEMMLLRPHGEEQVHLHLPESQLPPALLPRTYFAV